MTGRFSGVHWMLATPFNEDEEVDTASILRLVAKAQESGCQGVVALGVTGEAARLTDAERRLVVKKVVEKANGMPVTIGTTAASTRATISYSREAQELGAAAVMISAPPMAKPNLDTLLTHYQRIAEAVDLPIVVQDYPQTSEEIFYRYLPLLLFEFQEAIGIGIRKYALYHRGLIHCPKVRHPGSDISEETRKGLLHLIERLGL